MALEDLEHGSSVADEQKGHDQGERQETLSEKTVQNGDETATAASKTDQVAFPEGGLRAWSVVAATAGCTFCTFGYTNAFG
jgi:hypothetical protein